MVANIIKDVEIFGVGKWLGSGMKEPVMFTLDFLKRIVLNTKKLPSTIKMPVKLGHSEDQILDQKGGQPALGWLENVRIKGDKIIADLIDVPEILMKAIKKKLFKKVSVELGNTKNLGSHVTGLAVLGADLPAVKTLQDLDKYFTDNDNLNPDISLCFSGPIFNNEEIMSDKNQDSDWETKFAAREAGLAKKEAEILLKEKKIEEEKIEALFSSKKEDILIKFKQQVKDGKLLPSLIEKIEKDLDGKKITFSSNSELSLSMSTIEELSKSYSSLGTEEKLKQEDGGKELDIEDKVEKAVNEMMIKTGKNYGDASGFLFSANPSLLKEYEDYSNNEYRKRIQQ